MPVNGLVVFGIHETQFLEQGGESVGLVARAQESACLVVDGGDVVDTLAHGINVQHAASGEQQGGMCG